ncbi:MAG: DUF389 domain-containing protein [Rickettsiales bacterium]|jgi:hypothetical protein|nr:DUF389 domain-containing protein [Rickettsiales bacterium]
MNYKIIDVILPNIYEENLNKISRKAEVLKYWCVPVCDGETLKYSFLIRNTSTEIIIDSIVLTLRMEHKIEKKEDLSSLITITDIDALLPQISENKDEFIHKKRVINRVSIEELSENIEKSVYLSSSHIFNTIFATVLCCIGYIKRDPTLYMAAASVSSILSSIIGYAVAVSVGDKNKIRNSLKTVFVACFTSFLVSYTTSFLVGYSRYDYANDLKHFFKNVRFDAFTPILSVVSGLSISLGLVGGLSTFLLSFMLGVSITPVLSSVGSFFYFGMYNRLFEMILLLLMNFTCFVLSSLLIFKIKKVLPRNRDALKERKKYLYVTLFIGIIIMVYFYLSVENFVIE